MNNINEKMFSIEYQNKIYSKSKWFALTSQIDFHQKPIKPKSLNTLTDLKYIRTNYLKNLKIFTFWGLYFPLIVFLLLFLVISWFLSKSYRTANFLNDNQIIFIIFLRFVFFGFFLGFAYKIFFKGQKCIYTFEKNHYQYRFISKQEINNNLSLLDKQIKNDYYYFAPLETNRLIIRELQEIDLHDYYNFMKSKKVHQFLMSKPVTNKKETSKLIEQAIKDYKQHLLYRLAIELKKEAKVIGFIGLSRYDLTEISAQIVYAIHEDYWHQGYMSEAVISFVNYLKSQGKKLIIGGHIAQNSNSGKVLLKSGFQRKPELDYQMLIKGKQEHINIYTIDERN